MFSEFLEERIMYQVSILVPVYGVEKYIERCARSLFEQTYDNLEYIFVDDCTEDKSIEILKRVMEDFPARKEQVHILHHERNRGLAAARNTALDAATSPVVSHVDSDDYLDRDSIRLLVEKQVEAGADIVTGNYYLIDSRGVKEMYEPEYGNPKEMLQTVLSVHSSTNTIWRRLINIRLYRDPGIRPKEGVNCLEDWQQISKLVYFAEKVARVYDHIYYYNRTNDKSYVAKNVNLPSVRFWEQAVESAGIIEDFFSDKAEYRDLARRMVIQVMKTRMSLAARHRERAFFEKMRDRITTAYVDCYDVIGWDNPIVRTFMCNFFLNSHYRRVVYAVRKWLRR